MTEKEIGVEQARKILGQLADAAALDGQVTYLTRRGRRYAAIVPMNRILEEPAMTDSTRHLTIPARELRNGDLMQVSVDSTNYVIIADATEADGHVAVTVYNGTRPHNKPTLSFLADKDVRLSGRGITP